MFLYCGLVPVLSKTLYFLSCRHVLLLTVGTDRQSDDHSLEFQCKIKILRVKKGYKIRFERDVQKESIKNIL